MSRILIRNTTCMARPCSRLSWAMGGPLIAITRRRSRLRASRPPSHPEGTAVSLSARQRLDQHIPIRQPVVELLHPDAFVEAVRELFAIHDEDPADTVRRYPHISLHRDVGCL